MFLRIGLALLLATSAAAQQPKLNGLELRKGHDIQEAQQEAVLDSQKAQANYPLAQKALADAQAAYDKQLAEPFSVKLLLAHKVHALTPASDALTTAQHKLAAADAARTATANRITQLAAQMDDWEQQTLKAHSAADGKHKVDWTKGTIVAKETP